MTTENIQTADVAIIGAGPAGMMCALHAARRGRRVIILDHAKTVGSKLAISGGGHCNFTNTHARADAYVSENPHFCKSALSRFTPADIVAMVHSHGIATHEKKDGQLFCDGSARQIVRMMEEECVQAGAIFHLDCRVQAVCKENRRFQIQTSRGDFRSGSLVVATGGLSYPKTGASDLGYRIARQFGLTIVSPAPALAGFVLDCGLQKEFKGLAGVALEAVVTINGHAFRENVLFTHTGLSGPAIFQASLYWNPGDPLSINFVPDVDLWRWFEDKKKRGAKAAIKNGLAELVPSRFAETMCELYLSGCQNLANVSREKLEPLFCHLEHWRIIPAKTYGYDRAEVTRGGVNTEELSSKTMECVKVPGLYFIGEVVDVTGQLGGYNLQWAWSSGWVAGQQG